MIVKACKGLSFKVQGIPVTEFKEATVSITHDVLSKIREGSLIDMATIKAPIVIPKPEPKPAPKIKQKNETEIKTVNKEK